ncbi:MAG: AmmeMemoRadiSam system protein A [Spirochaetia bacterium]|nr:AmmeMemoRadiSam system protein A [Spirochaetota bacterium]MCX8096108.1 AmmeMemoRadiSam system protein A [Spirochaetota bacterium]MDW8113226.1 AmmeMemoRadiSam system protein A [Spirochaetia bacterium]
MLNLSEKSQIIKLAELTLESLFKPEKKHEVEKQRKIVEKLGLNNGVFVTLLKKGELRGCIGYITPVKEFSRLLIDATISSATRDPRFDPLKKEELDEIEIEVSILSEPKKISSIAEIEVGKHGIIVRRGPYQGLLLPQVAVEHRWDKLTFLQHTCIKAGLHPNDYRKEDTEIYVFTAEVFSKSDLKGL